MDERKTMAMDPLLPAQQEKKCQELASRLAFFIRASNIARESLLQRSLQAIKGYAKNSFAANLAEDAGAIEGAAGEVVKGGKDEV